MPNREPELEPEPEPAPRTKNHEPRTGSGPASAFAPVFELFERARPVFSEQARERAVGQQAPLGRSETVAVVGTGRSFFDAVGLPILRGRGFDTSEVEGRAPAVVLSETASRHLWPDTDSLGQPLEITTRAGRRTVTVIGVSRDPVSYAEIGLAAPEIYRPFEEVSGRDGALLVRTNVDPHTLLGPVAAAVRTSATLPMPRALVIGDRLGRLPGESKFMIRLFAGFAVVALLLATSGIFGVVSQSVAQRTPEFGVRMALGATAGRVLFTVIARETKLIAAALVSGAIGTVAVTRVVFAELVTISATDPALWLVVVAICGGTAATACALATHRIVNLDPWIVLRKRE